MKHRPASNFDEANYAPAPVVLGDEVDLAKLLNGSGWLELPEKERNALRKAS